MLTYNFLACNWDDNKAEEGLNIVGIDDGGVRRFDICLATENGQWPAELSSEQDRRLIEAFWSRANDSDITRLCIKIENEFEVEELRGSLLNAIESESMGSTGTMGLDWMGVVEIDGDNVAVFATNGYTTWQHLCDVDPDVYPELVKAMEDHQAGIEDAMRN